MPLFGEERIQQQPQWAQGRSWWQQSWIFQKQRCMWKIGHHRHLFLLLSRSSPHLQSTVQCTPERPLLPRCCGLLGPQSCSALLRTPLSSLPSGFCCRSSWLWQSPWPDKVLLMLWPFTTQLRCRSWNFGKPHKQSELGENLRMLEIEIEMGMSYSGVTSFCNCRFWKREGRHQMRIL